MNFTYFAIIFCSVITLVSCHQDDTIVTSDSSNFSFDNFQNNTGLNDREQCDFSAPIYPDTDTTLTRQQLADLIKYCFSPSTTYTYSQARTFLYSDIDVVNGKLQCIYSGYEATVDPAAGQSYINAAASAGINCEHVYPQSMGASEEPAQSDMFHIYPELANVNTERSNKYFAEIPDDSVFEWFAGSQVQTSKPTENIDLWSESVDTAWEPRESVKGDIARSVFYFRTIYDDVANIGYFDQMKSTLLQWNEQDPVDQAERNRNNKILQLQGNNNPFILDPSLANRLYE